MWEIRSQSCRRNLRRVFKNRTNTSFCLAYKKKSNNLQWTISIKTTHLPLVMWKAKTDLKSYRRKSEWEGHWNNLWSCKNLVRSHFLSCVRQLRLRCWKKTTHTWLEIGIGSQVIISLLILGKDN